MIHWDYETVRNVIKAEKIPYNALHDQGYPSIGCEPCTVKYTADMLEDGNRGGRWAGQNKTECGLHTTLGAK